MNQDTKACRNCGQNFGIEAEDADFYEKIGVPPPTWCPPCRQQRRYAWRNERTLYRRDCDLCGKSTVTIYAPDGPFTVYCPSCWWSDDWNPHDYGQDIDSSRPFFEQWKDLQLKVPRLALLGKRSINSDYTNHSGDSKNCYLCFGVFNGENIMYSTNVYGGTFRDSMELYHVTQGGELLYECVDSENSYNCQYGRLLRGCSDCYYSFDLRGCSHCFLCWNLRNKQYCIMNRQYGKEEYENKIKEYNLGSFTEREGLYRTWRDMIENNALHEYATIEQSVNSSGSMLIECKNVSHSFDIDQEEDGKYNVLNIDAKTSMDIYHVGLGTELNYESHGCTRNYNSRFVHLSYDNSNIEYADCCQNCENCFGCAGLKKGRYSILNRRYEKEEYERLREQLISHMSRMPYVDSRGIEHGYGEFFPPELSPVSYNETQGQVYMPLPKEEVQRRGWKWQEHMPGTFGKETMRPEAVPDSITDTDGSITKEVLVCSECKRNYNIVEPEFQLYTRLTIPLPRLCPDCRYRRKIALRPSRRLWQGTCQCAGTKSTNGKWTNTVSHKHGNDPCPNAFQTPYAPERPETLYCQNCYQAEVT